MNCSGWSIDMGAVLNYAAEASEVLAFLVMLPAVFAAARKRRRERRRAYQPRHARAGGAAARRKNMRTV